MSSRLLINCLWFEGITPDQFKEMLGLDDETLLRKIFNEVDFTSEEIEKIVNILKLTEEERKAIFG